MASKEANLVLMGTEVRRRHKILDIIMGVGPPKSHYT